MGNIGVWLLRAPRGYTYLCTHCHFLEQGCPELPAQLAVWKPQERSQLQLWKGLKRLHTAWCRHFELLVY